MEKIIILLKINGGKLNFWLEPIAGLDQHKFQTVNDKFQTCLPQ